MLAECLYGFRRLLRNVLAARNLVQEEGCGMDSKPHLSTAIESRSTHPGIELFNMSENCRVTRGRHPHFVEA
jgi:hypothetical protein